MEALIIHIRLPSNLQKNTKIYMCFKARKGRAQPFNAECSRQKESIASCATQTFPCLWKRPLNSFLPSSKTSILPLLHAKPKVQRASTNPHTVIWGGGPSTFLFKP